MIREVSRRYASYKGSEVEWLGEVPECWEVKRLKDLTKILTCGFASTPEYVSEENGMLFLSAQNVRPNRLDLSKYNYISKELHKQLTKYRRPLKNDVLVTRVGAGIGDACIVDINLEFSIYVSLTHIRTNDEIIPSFLVYFFGTNYLSILNKASTPDGGGQGNLNVKNVNRFLIATPPLTEQKAIANYLDTKTAQIDKKIDLLTQKTKNYGKLKQSLINETVIRGLDKNVPMRNSGIEWLGDIPEHWELKRLKELSNIQNSNVDKKSHEYEQAVKLCNYVDVYKNEFINSSLEFMQATADKSEIKRFTVKENDVLITKDSETCDDIAVPALAKETLEGVLCGYHLAQIRTKEKLLLGSYLFRLFQSNSYGFRYVIYAKGITRVGLGQSAIADSLTLLPPLTEQKSITTYLDKEIAKIDMIIETINIQIDKLKELRKTLINDVVTGQIKVV